MIRFWTFSNSIQLHHSSIVASVVCCLYWHALSVSVVVVVGPDPLTISPFLFVFALVFSVHKSPPMAADDWQTIEKISPYVGCLCCCCSTSLSSWLLVWLSRRSSSSNPIYAYRLFAMCLLFSFLFCMLFFVPQLPRQPQKKTTTTKTHTHTHVWSHHHPPFNDLQQFFYIITISTSSTYIPLNHLPLDSLSYCCFFSYLFMPSHRVCVCKRTLGTSIETLYEKERTASSPTHPADPYYTQPFYYAHFYYYKVIAHTHV